SSVSAHHTGLEGVLTVSTSQPILEEGNIKQLIKIEPAVNFDVAFSELGFVITSKDFSTEKNYTLTLLKEMEGVFGGKFKTDYTEIVFFGELTPSIDFANNKGMYLSSKGYKNVALNIVNVPEIVVTVVKVY